MLKTPLGRYRLMAYVVGTLLIVLVFIGVPLRYAGGIDVIAKYVGMLHGFLYLVYLVTCLELVLRYRLNVVRFVLMAAAGFVPFLSFVMERKTVELFRAREAAALTPAANVAAPAD
jgi:integral membrane protein